MTGEVTKVDAKKGWVDVKTSEGSMKLHFPPDALQTVKKGDSVTVDLGTGGAHGATMWTCDFSAEYVRINAEYRT